MVSHDSTTANREIEIEKFNTQRSWREYMALLRGTTQRGQGRVQKDRQTDRKRHTERQDLGHIFLIGSQVEVLWGFWARARLFSSNEKSGILISPMGVLSKGYIRHKHAGRQGRLLNTKAVRKVISGFAFTCDSAVALQGLHLNGGASVSSRSLRASWSSKMDAEEQLGNH